MLTAEIVSQRSKWLKFTQHLRYSVNFATF